MELISAGILREDLLSVVVSFGAAAFLTALLVLTAWKMRHRVTRVISWILLVLVIVGGVALGISESRALVRSGPQMTQTYNELTALGPTSGPIGYPSRKWPKRCHQSEQGFTSVYTCGSFFDLYFPDRHRQELESILQKKGLAKAEAVKSGGQQHTIFKHPEGARVDLISDDDRESALKGTIWVRYEHKTGDVQCFLLCL